MKKRCGGCGGSGLARRLNDEDSEDLCPECWGSGEADE